MEIAITAVSIIITTVDILLEINYCYCFRPSSSGAAATILPGPKRLPNPVPNLLRPKVPDSRVMALTLDCKACCLSFKGFFPTAVLGLGDSVFGDLGARQSSYPGKHSSCYSSRERVRPVPSWACGKCLCFENFYYWTYLSGIMGNQPFS